MIRLTDEQWERIRDHFPEENIADGRPGRKPIPTRCVLEAVLWILNTGAQWHMLPQSYPNYKTVHRRFQTWCRDAVLRRVSVSGYRSVFATTRLFENQFDVWFGSQSGLCGQSLLFFRVAAFSRALPVGHAFSDKFSSVSFCNVLLPCLCDALLTILPTQRRSAQGWRSGCCCLSHDVSSEQNQRENNQ
jgi:transposase